MTTSQLAGVWLGAGVLFVVIAEAMGGPRPGDAAESTYSTWAIAHGVLACAYPPASHAHFTSVANPVVLIAPLYPLLSGLLADLARVGHAWGFPSAAQMGPACSHAFVAMWRWSRAAGALNPTLQLGYLGWFALFLGAANVLRVSRWGRTRREALTLTLLAVAPPVATPLIEYFHPQDMLAMGLCLVALAAAVRQRWWAAGVAMGLAVASQQFALLAVIALCVVIPRRARLATALGALGAGALVAVPLLIATSGRVARSLVLGSNRLSPLAPGGARSAGGAVLGETNWGGAGLFVVSRVVPLLAGLVLALWVRRRLGERALAPVPLMALVATSLSLRLVFEVNLFGYYLMALAATLIVLDGVSGRVRGEVVTWLALVTLAYNPVPTGVASSATLHGVALFRALPVVFSVVVAVLVVGDLARRRARLYLVAALVVGVWSSHPQLWGSHPLVRVVAPWEWQVILVSSGLYLAASRLVAEVRGAPGSASVVTTPASATPTG